MNELTDLYQEVILDHNRQPRNCRELASPTHRARGHNPLCGDQIAIALEVEDGIIKDIGFQGAGCAISTASASLMTEALKARQVDDARRIFADFRCLVTGNAPGGNLGKLEVFSGVSEYPARVKCATLCWHTVNAALDERPDDVTTE